MRKILLVVLILSLCGTASYAQQHRHLTLEESIEIAKEKSLSMLKLKQSLEQAEHNLQAAVRSLRTNIDLTLTMPEYNDIVSRYEDKDGNISYYSNKKLDFSSNLTVNQPLPTDGRVYLSNIIGTTDDLRKDSENRFTDARIRLGISQPLDAFYGFNNVRSTLKRARLDHERSSKALKREELNLIYSVSSSFYNLLSLQEQANIALLDLERQTEAQEISKNKYEAGLIREVDALQMEVDLAEAQNQYDISLLNQNEAMNSLKELLGISLQDSITLNSDLSYNKVIVDPAVAVKYAMDNRLEIREQDIRIEQQELSVKQQKAAGMIKASLDAYYEQAGVDWNSNRSMFSSVGSAFSNFKDYPSNFHVGFTVRIPILDWGLNRSRVRVQESILKEIEYSKLEIERSIETEVKSLVSKINSNLKSLQLLEKNVAVAEKSFEITRQRYSDGDINSQDLALERERLNRAYTSRLTAFINYQLSLADLLRKTFYDFELNQPVL